MTAIRPLLLAACTLAAACNESGPGLVPAAGQQAIAYTEADFGTDGRPLTIPALRGWAPLDGQFAYGPESGIVAFSGHGLDDVAALFAQDLEEVFGTAPAVFTATKVAAGKILLRLGPPDGELGTEGYELKISDSVTVTAPTATGVFYGTRTLLQLLRQGDTIAAGLARDWPRYPERGLMVDVGRMYFTVPWIEARIRELAALKMNLLHLHVSDNEGWRIASDVHPEIVSDPHLTKAELAALLDLAARHHITVVPEIDMPGHMTAALAPYPDYQLANVLGQREEDKLDVSNDAARAFARELIAEYLPLFPGPYWHMGADEYLGIVSTEQSYELYPQLQAYAQERYGPQANHKDAVLDFIQEINVFVRERGKTLRVWHDGLGGGSAVTVDNDITVEVWNDFAGAQPPELLALGHRIFNAGWYPTYYTQSAYGFVRPDMPSAYEGWNVHQFYGPFVLNDPLGFPPTEIDPAEPLNLGSKIHVWSDVPQLEDESEVAAGIYPRLRVLAQKTWESEPLVATYDEFLAVMEAVDP